MASLPELDLSAVFSDPEDDEESNVRYLIHLLTCLMADTQCGPAMSAPDDLKSRIWKSLSVLLNTGMSRGGTHLAVATAGHIDLTGIRTFVVAQNAYPASQEDGITTEVTEVESRGVEAGIEVLTNPNTEPIVPFAEHAAQVLSVMTYLLKEKGNLPYANIQPLLIDFTVCRTYLKTCMRLENGYRIFLNHPLRVFHEFFLEDASRAEAVQTLTFTTRSYVIKRALAEAGISPLLEKSPFAGEELPPAGEKPPPPVYYQLTPRNVPLWTQVLLNCLVDLENVLIRRRNGQGTEYLLLDTDEKRAVVRDNLHILDAMLDKNGIIDGLMTAALTEKLFVRYDGCIRSSKSDNSDCDHPTASHEEPEDEDIASEIAAVSVQEPGEPPNGPVRRYLKSLTLPYTAPCTLIAMTAEARSMKVGSDISMTVISVPSAAATPAESTNVLDRLEKQLETSFTPTEHAAARARFNEYRQQNKKQKQVQSVHAEAALMGVAYANAQGLLDKSIHGLDDLRDAFIGIERRSCYTCDLLGTMLNVWRQERPSRQSTFPLIRLPGSHAVIRPWLPPPQGIPLKVLRDVRDDLLMEFWQVIRDGCTTGFPHTSPADEGMLGDDRSQSES